MLPDGLELDGPLDKALGKLRAA